LRSFWAFIALYFSSDNDVIHAKLQVKIFTKDIDVAFETGENALL
jgi:hypothetical protein